MNRSTMLSPLLLLIASCGADVDDEWYADPGFTETERAHIVAGTEWLYEKAGLPPPVIRWDGGGEHKITIIRGPSPWCASTCLKREVGLGYVYVDPAQGEVTALVAHEMAHCVLGFKDRYGVDRPHSDGIMGVRSSPPLWTESEEEQCRERGTCRRPDTVF